MRGWTSPASSEALLKPLVFVALAAPLAWLGWAVIGELEAPGSRLGADPGEAVVLFLGEWSMRMLLLALAVSTLRRRLGASRLLRVRRMVGLFAFAYVAVHFLAYLGFLAEFDWRVIEEDLLERTYITVGFLALCLLVPLAVTSTNGWQRRLRQRWRRLHRLIYVIVPLALLHLFWLTKDGYGEPLAYLAIYTLLMLERLVSERGRTPAAA